MNYSNEDKQAILDNQARFITRITVLSTGVVFTEDDFVVDWNYEDYRYVPNNGFIGQFVERLLDVTLKNIEENTLLVDEEIKLELGVVNDETGITTYYDYGNFIITKVGEADTTGKVKIESSDYTKKFNVPFVSDDINFPITALELANIACSKAGVELKTNGTAYCYILPEGDRTVHGYVEPTLPPGNYSFKINNTYYNFTTTSTLKTIDSLMYVSSLNKVIQTIVTSADNDYDITRTNLNVTTGNSATGTLLEGHSTGYVDFIHNDFVIKNAQYDSPDTLRKVMQDIGKLAYSWVRVDENNEVLIDFTQSNTVDTQDEIDTDLYYELVSQPKVYGPVKRVLVGVSQINGENVYREDEDAGENPTTLNIYDCNLTNTQELRKIALVGCDVLYGLTYTPLKIKTIGHPWLRGNELIGITNLQNERVVTYPFDRKIAYKGFIKSEIASTGDNQVQSDYQFKSDTVSAIKKTEISVDKANQRIDSVIAGTNNELTAIRQTINNLQFNVQGSGGNNYVLNSVGFAGTKEWTTVVDTGGTIQTITSTALREHTVSGGAFVLNGCKIKQEITVIGNTEYAFSCLVSKNGLTSSTGYVRIYDKNNINNAWEMIFDGNTKYEYTKVDFSGDFVLIENIVYPSDNIFPDNTLYPTTTIRNGGCVKIPSTTLVIEIYGNEGSDFTVSDIMLSQGTLSSVWTQASGEILNTQVNIDKDGVKVVDENFYTTGNYTIITPEEFAGYSNVNGQSQKVFTINGDRTEMYKVKIEKELSMSPIKIVPITTSTDNGWAFVPGDD